MSRDIPADVQAGLQAPDSVDALLVFLTVRHPLLPEPIRVVSDVMDYEVGGQVFKGLPFEADLLPDGESAPVTSLRMQNVDGRIGAALLPLDERAEVSLEIRSSADFDLSQDPRVEIGPGSVIYAFSGFDLVDATVTDADVTGRVMLRDFSQEPFPGQRSTQSRCPALFR